MGDFQVDSCTMAGNNEQKDEDLGDAGLQSLWVTTLSVEWPLSVSQGKKERFGCCILAGLILIRGSLGWRKHLIPE